MEGVLNAWLHVNCRLIFKILTSVNGAGKVKEDVGPNAQFNCPVCLPRPSLKIGRTVYFLNAVKQLAQQNTF